MKLNDTQQVIAYTIAAYIHRAAKQNDELALQDCLIAAQQLIDRLTPDLETADPNDPFA
jgi:hypothetical protein